MSIPRQDALLVSWANNFATRISAEGNPYGISTGQQAEMTARAAAFADAYNGLMNARANGTRSASMTAAKTSAKKALLAIGREVYAIISANTAISDADRILAGINVRAPRTSIPAPTVEPVVSVVSVVCRTVAIRIRDSASTTNRGKPRGCRSAFVYCYVGREYPSDPAAWTFKGATTRTKYDISFDSAIPGGSTVWIYAAWANAKEQVGPPSIPVATTLQGGGSTIQPTKLAA
jgi:hypothetical protein